MKKLVFLSLNSVYAPNGPVVIHKIRISKIRDYILNNLYPIFVFKEGLITSESIDDQKVSVKKRIKNRLSNIGLIVVHYVSRTKYLRVILFFYKLGVLKLYVDRYYNQKVTCDVMICDSEFECFYALKKRKNNSKIVMYQHNDGYPCKMTFNQYPELKKFLWFIYRKKLDYTLKNLDGIIFLSEQFKNNFLSKYGGDGQKKLSVIPNGMPDKFKSKNTPNDKIRIVCAGTITKRKGQKIIVDSVIKLEPLLRNQFEFIICGDGPEYKVINELINSMSLGNIIKLKGMCSNSVIIEEMINSDAVILMSEDEGMPLSIIEGMMTGCAVITTDVGCVREMISGNCGYIVNRNSYDLASLLTSISLPTLESMGLRARNRYLTNYSSDIMLKKEIEYYQNF